MSQLILSGGFLVALLFPLASLRSSNSAATIPQREHREAAPFPEWEQQTVLGVPLPRKRSVKQFPRAFQSWFDDHLGGRNHLLESYNLARVIGLTNDLVGTPSIGSLQNSPVIIGRNGWLFYSGEGMIDYHRGTHLFTETELTRWRQVFTERAAWLNDRGIRYVVVFVPNKHTIYSEHLPRRVNQVRSENRLDQLLAVFEENETLTCVDLRKALQNGKASQPVFYKTDTHWNEYGAFLGYQELLQSFPEMAHRELSQFAVTTASREGMFLAEMMKSSVRFEETEVSLRPLQPRQATMTERPRTAALSAHFLSQHPDAELPRAVVLHDSFMPAMQPFLNEHFEQVRYLWTYEFLTEWIEQDRPDVVIQQIVERKLMTLQPVNHLP